MSSSEVTLLISGMHCGSCVNRVRLALSKVEGVEVREVGIGSARITAPQDLADGELQSAIEKIGFQLATISR